MLMCRFYSDFATFTREQLCIKRRCFLTRKISRLRHNIFLNTVMLFNIYAVLDVFLIGCGHVFWQKPHVRHLFAY